MLADAGDGALADMLAAPTLGIGAAVTALVASACVAGILVGRRARGEPLVRPGVAEPVAWDGMDVTWVVVVALLLQSLAAAMGPNAPSLDRQLVSGMLATGAAAVIAAWHLRRRGASWPALGFRVAEWPTAILQAVGAVALVVAPLLATAACLDRIVPYRHPLVEFLATHRDAASIALVWLAATVTAPIVEEFFFRRILQGWLEKWLTGRVRPPDAARLAIAGSAVLFALAHLGHGLAWVPLLGLGGVLGYLARQTGSIVPGILAHAMFNAVSVILVLALQPAAAG